MQKTDLKRAGLKITLPRLKVLEALQNGEPHHMSAEDVFNQLSAAGEAVALGTVYRVLTQFEVAGIVERHNFDDGRAVFEIASDDHHDHMVDVDSGEVIEFVNKHIEDLQHELVRERGYELVDHQLVLYVRKSK